MCELQRQQERNGRSLGCIKPATIEKLLIEPADPTWNERKQDVIDQMVLFDPVDTKLEKISFIFKYRYRCCDPKCQGHNQSILDWELMQLYRKVRDKHPGQEEMERKIREKFLDEVCSPQKDTHFFVGNHSRYPASFMVLGAFWPPKNPQRAML